MYCVRNFQTKKELVAAVKAGEQIRCFSPGPFPCPTQGSVSLEGPHYPKPHKWYASAVLENGVIKSVK